MYLQDFIPFVVLPLLCAAAILFPDATIFGFDVAIIPAILLSAWVLSVGLAFLALKLEGLQKMQRQSVNMVMSLCDGAMFLLALLSIILVIAGVALRLVG